MGLKVGNSFESSSAMNMKNHQDSEEDVLNELKVGPSRRYALSSS